MDKDIGRRMFQQTKEIRGKGRTREAIGLQGVFEVFNEILTLPPLTIRVIEQRGSELRERGHHKPGIGAVLTDFRFHDHVPGLRPALRRIGKGVKVLHGLLRGPKAARARNALAP
jgi:hypothetical protein